jgi:hypothetical protein
MSFVKILALDFDGVLHSYKSGWKGPRTIPDEPVEGAIEFVESFILTHCTYPESMCAMAPTGQWELCIYSSRSRYFGGRSAMRRWLVKHGMDPRFLEVIKFPLFKPPATVQLDDRAIMFTGNWPEFHEITEFRPWNKGGPRKKVDPPVPDVKVQS